MAEDNGLHDANQNMQEDQAATSTTLGLEIEAAASSCTNGGRFDIDQQKKSKKLESSTKTVPFYKLFSFADSVDVALMIVGTIGAVGNGIGIPFTSVFFGEMIDSFGQNQNSKDIVHVVSKVALKYVYLALGVGVAAFLQRQAARIRHLYLKSIMRQDIAFFDKETNTGEVVSMMSGDTVLIQDAMSEKGFVIAFIKGWLLTLVLLSCIPLLVITGGAAAIITSKASSSAQNSYSKANVVEQTIGSIRTVFNHAWYGAKLIVNKRYTGGEVINVIAAVLTGSVSLGQTSPCMNAFSACQAAGFKIYPARPDEKIFNGFSLSIPNGMTATMVGQSGRGKSTIISLIQRFYDPQPGQVLVDGINLKDFHLKWIREKIGLFSQEPMLFACSIKDNIAYGKDEATLEEIEVAVEIANATKFIDKLPQGLDTMVTTSALDAESERIVQEALDKIMVNRTTVIVAHRLSTLLYEEAIQFANDAVGSIRTIASFCGEEKVMELYKRKCEGPMKTGIRQGLFSGIGFGLSSASIYLAYGCNFYTGAKLVDDKRMIFDEYLSVSH
ncbi:hypothetical protein C3L33_23277, partial [Rhododendron williamsianum]